jgi:hypothetical protein
MERLLTATVGADVPFFTESTTPRLWSALECRANDPRAWSGSRCARVKGLTL